MTKLPISVFIIARNEADRLPPVIRSVRDCVAIVLVAAGRLASFSRASFFAISTLAMRSAPPKRCAAPTWSLWL